MLFKGQNPYIYKGLFMLVYNTAFISIHCQSEERLQKHTMFLQTHAITKSVYLYLK